MSARSIARKPNPGAIEALRNGKRVSVQLDKATAEQVVALAEREERSISYMVNKLVEQGLASRQRPARREEAP